MRKLLFLKLYSSAKDVDKIIDYLVQSYESKENRYYSVNATDKDNNKDLKSGDEVLLVAIPYHKNDNKVVIEKAYLGYGIYEEKGGSRKIKYWITESLSNDTALQNICKQVELNMEKDYADQSYLLRVDSELVKRQVADIVWRLREEKEAPATEYKPLRGENRQLHPLAQRNEYCRRPYGLRPQSKNIRGEFQRDYERIVHSKAFRRMVDKAQVYGSYKGDYYRTRMTHSQIVSQVSRAIAGGLKLNIFLTEAIALGHDIGHTPFGHQGERTLNDILRGKGGFDIIQDRQLLYDNDKKEGFKHNYQSVRLATVLEEHYAEMPGLDLSFQTLEGMLKHTKLKKEEQTLRSYVDLPGFEENLHYEDEFSSTLEGQVVYIADEIAQRSHDLDDAMTSGAIKFEELEQYLKLNKMERLAKLLKKVQKEIDGVREGGRRMLDENEIRKERTVSAILAFFVNDVIKHSKDAMKQYDQNAFEADGHIVKDRLVYFSADGKMLNDYLETIISNRVINNPEVTLFDSNAVTVVSGLFRAYYNNPMLLARRTKRRLFLDILKQYANAVDFEYGDIGIIRKELALMTRENLCEMEDEERRQEYITKRRILVRTICDYISGMTDSYALAEYRKLL